MSLNSDQSLQQATVLQSRFSERVRQLRNDLSLSDQGRQAAMATDYLATKQKMADLRQGQADARDARKRVLEAEIFGLGDLADPASRVAQEASFRDALDRADKAVQDGPGPLERLLDRALRTADELQAKACVSVALEVGAGAVIDTYLREHAALEGPLDELSVLVGTRRQAMTSRMADSMSFSVPRPTELGTLDDFRLNRLIEDVRNTASN